MDWIVFVIECCASCIIFGIFVFGMLLINPVSFVSDYPPKIQERYYQSQNLEKEKPKLNALMIIKKVLAMICFLFVFAWMASLTKVTEYYEYLLVIYGYILCLVCFDTFFLDWVLFPNIKKVRLPGTLDMDKEYHQKWFHVKVLFPMIPVFIVGGLLSALIGFLIW